MKPTYASRETNCEGCKEIIVPGSKRIDEVFRNKHPQSKVPFLRYHYHLDCYVAKLKSWFEKNQYKPTPGAGGRPVSLSDLTPTEKEERHRIQVRLAAHINYYSPRLNIQAKDITEMSPIDLARFLRFYQRRKELLDALDRLGGIPKKYQGLETPTIVDLLPKIPTEAEGGVEQDHEVEAEEPVYSGKES